MNIFRATRTVAFSIAGSRSTGFHSASSHRKSERRARRRAPRMPRRESDFHESHSQLTLVHAFPLPIARRAGNSSRVPVALAATARGGEWRPSTSSLTDVFGHRTPRVRSASLARTPRDRAVSGGPARSGFRASGPAIHLAGSGCSVWGIGAVARSARDAPSRSRRSRGPA